MSAPKNKNTPQAPPSPEKPSWRRRLLILPGIVIGVLVVVFLARNRRPAEKRPVEERAVRARVIEVPAVELVPRALGYGPAEPEKVWQAVAQVGGKIVEMSPLLRRGQILTSGALLLRIDPTDYELAAARQEASVRETRVRMEELRRTEENYRRSLAIDERSLELGEKELTRKARLLAAGTISQSDYDVEERAVLQLRNAVQNDHNQLNLIPAQLDLLEAQLPVALSQLAQARLDLARTRIHAPFPCRVSEVNVEVDQYTPAGRTLARADSILVTEVTAQLPLSRMRWVVDPEVKLENVREQEFAEIVERLGLAATVRVRSGDLAVEWEARVVRLSDTIDPKTRTLGVVVAVEDPYEKARPGTRPPLVKGMYCEVEIRGRARPGRLVVPAVAIHDGHAYVVGKDNRLEIRPVAVRFDQASFVVIDRGLNAGDVVVVSDLLPAIEGALVEPTTDTNLRNALVAEATGRGEAR